MNHPETRGQSRVSNQLAARRLAALRLPPIRLSCGCYARDPDLHRCPKRWNRKEAA